MPPKPDAIIEEKIAEETVVTDPVVERRSRRRRCRCGARRPAERGEHLAVLAAVAAAAWPRTRTRRQSRTPRRRDENKSDLLEKVVFINRCAKVVKGGRRFSFSALLVVGDRKGKVGVGFGKANEVTEAIRKATDAARKHLEPVSLRGPTIPHEVMGQFGGGGSSCVPLRPEPASSPAAACAPWWRRPASRTFSPSRSDRAIPANVVKATLDALKQLRPKEAIFQLRGKTIKVAAPACATEETEDRSCAEPPRRGKAKGEKTAKAEKAGESDPALAS